MKRKSVLLFCAFICVGLMDKNCGYLWAGPSKNTNAPAGAQTMDPLSPEALADIPVEFQKQTQDYFERWGREAGRQWAAKTGPAVDVRTTPDELIVECDVPGWDKKDIQVELKNNILVIRGERTAEKKSENADYYNHERSQNSFERRLTLPVPVVQDRISAQQQNGVLTIHFVRKSETGAVRGRFHNR